MKQGTRLPTADREGVIELAKSAIRESWQQKQPVKASDLWRSMKDQHPDVKRMRFRQFSTGVVLPARYAVQEEGLSDPAGRLFKAPGRPMNVTPQAAKPLTVSALRRKKAPTTGAADERIQHELYEMARELITAKDFVMQLRILPDLLEKYSQRLGHMTAA